MSSKIKNLTVQIVRFVDNRQPGWVQCTFTDAEGRDHKLLDKAPIFTGQILDAATSYPQSGKVRCTILDEWRDSSGRELRRITTAEPDGVESSEHLSEFVVLAAQIS